jgi:hypothetical protein
MTKRQKAIAELYAPVILKSFGSRHRCQKRVVGARGQWRNVYCRECNLAAIAAAKRIALMHAADRRRA